jgi:hypothetical protein
MCPYGIFSSKMGSWSLKSSLLIAIILYIITAFAKKLLHGERTKKLKAFLGSLFR